MPEDDKPEYDDLPIPEWIKERLRRKEDDPPDYPPVPEWLVAEVAGKYHASIIMKATPATRSYMVEFSARLDEKTPSKAAKRLATKEKLTTAEALKVFSEINPLVYFAWRADEERKKLSKISATGVYLSTTKSAEPPAIKRRLAEAPATYANLDTSGISGAKDEGILNKALATVLREWGVPKDQFQETAAEIERLVKARVAAAARPKWDERHKYDELRQLSSPAFLKRVYADVIAKDGSIEKQLIRDTDARLMASVETYMSNRKAREQDAGDAKGLRLIAGPTSPLKAANLG
jgi:hypothetical protein